MQSVLWSEALVFLSFFRALVIIRSWRFQENLWCVGAFVLVFFERLSIVLIILHSTGAGLGWAGLIGCFQGIHLSLEYMLCSRGEILGCGWD
jgi:hypothetical protein